jgi:hypothetical protein
MKILLLVMILCISSLTFAQQGSKAELIDEFKDFNCEIFLARMDNFYIRLNNDPSSTGYLVISGNKTQTTRKLTVELLLESAVVARKYDRSRIEIVKGPESGLIKIELWVVPSGVQKPDFHESRWDLTIDKGAEPFMLDSEMAQICPSAPFDAVAGELLEANPSGMIYVIVHGKNPAQRSRELNLTRKRLRGINSKRVRFFLRRSYIGYSDYYFAIGRRDRNEFKSYLQ